MRVLGIGDGVFANDNCRLNDNYEPRRRNITNLATTGRSSCRPANLVDVDHSGLGENGRARTTTLAHEFAWSRRKEA